MPLQLDPSDTTLANGVRVITIPMPHLHTAAVSVFVRTGSAHESAALNGISHVIEHMAFKGTAEEDRPFKRPFSALLPWRPGQQARQSRR